MAPFAEAIQFRIDQLWSGSKLVAIFDKIKDQETYDKTALNALLVNTFTAVESQLQDGFQLKDIVPILSAALKDIMLVAEKLQGATGEDKLNFATEVFMDLYDFVDKGIDGTKNRIDIPYIPQIAEDFIEKRVLPIVLRFAIETGIGMLNKDKK